MAACAKHTVLSADQKKLIMKLHSEEKKQTEIAKLFGMNRSTVCCIIRQYERRRYWKICLEVVGPSYWMTGRRAQRALMKTLKRIVQHCCRNLLAGLTSADKDPFLDVPSSEFCYHRRVVRKIRIRHHNKRCRETKFICQLLISGTE